MPRILKLFHETKLCSFHWIPHFTSVINWTLRAGLFRLNQVAPISEPWIAIMDHSIDIGIKKILVVLRIPLNTLKEKGQALQLTDCECIGLCISEKTDYETVAEQLTSIFEQAGPPKVIVKDQAGNLSKGVQHWNKKAKIKKVVTVEDIGHVLANALKAQYEKTERFKQFLDIVRIGSARLRQTSLAFLVPPKIRTKGRFHSISKLAKWGETITEIMRKRGRAKEGSALDKLRKAMPEFLQTQPFLEEFALTTTIVDAICKVLKNRGLNQSTYREVKKLAEQLPKNSTARKRFLKWLNRHLSKQSRLGMQQDPLLVSSDIIECLFGKFKHLIERSPIADINRMALAIPVLCGEKIDESFISDVFSNTRHEDIAKWEEENISHTLRKKRKAFLGG